MKFMRFQRPPLWIVPLAALLVMGGFAARAEAQSVKTISWYAGGGPATPGDGGPATGAFLSAVDGMTVDAAGNLYIADYGRSVVRKVTAATGVITTVAGTGTAGYTGDGGPATAAQIDTPMDVAFDAAGNLYIACYAGNRVRKVSAATGIITTVAGTGAIGYNGDGIAATAANVSYPWGIAVNAAGDLFIAEHVHNRIRMVSGSTGLISTYAGTGASGSSGDGGPATLGTISSVVGMTIDAAGNIYFVQPSSNIIRMVTAATGVISTVAGVAAPGGFGGDGGPATEALLNMPFDVDVDHVGTLYIADSGNERVRRVVLSTGIISTAAGDGTEGYSGDGGPATLAQLDAPYGVAVGRAGEVYIADQGSSPSKVIRKVDGRDKPVITWPTPSPIVYGTPLSATQLNATANVSGTFVYDPPAGTVLNAGAGQALSVTFTPDDTWNYIPTTATTSLTVNKATPAITWTDPASIGYGTALSATQLNAIANIVGTFVYNPAAGTVLNGGAGQTLSVTFTPSDTTNHTTAVASVSITVTKAAPVITWQNPTPITSGTPLSSTQLNATANVPGSFVYTPPAGTTLSMGPGQTLSTAFTPANTGNYTTAAKQVTIDVTAGLPTGPPYTLTITPPTGGKVLGAGLNCGAGGTACAVSMPAAMTLGIQATASSGYTFAGWSGDCSGTGASVWVDLKGARTCAANFTPVGGTTYALTIAPAPTGGTVTGNGLTCGAGGATCAVTFGSSTTATLTATPATGFTFTSWGGACSGTNVSTSVLVDAARTCSAAFTASGGGGGGGLPTGPPYTLTITPPTGGKVLGAGLNCGAGGTACSVSMPAAMTLGIQATASSGYTFAGWSGDCSGTGASVWVDLKGARTCAANFTPVGGTTYSLTIAPAPTGGTVTGNGLTCGAGGATCSVTFGNSTTATLTATPASGFTFTSWGGACAGTTSTTSVLVDAARTCSAAFTASGGGGGLPTGPPYTLTITPPTGGKVLGAGLNCGAGGTACSVSMPAAMTLGIQATASSGYTFAGWSGDCSGTGASVWVDLKGARTCAANFTPVGGTTYALTIAPAPTGGTVTGNGLTCGAGGATCAVTFGSSTTATLTATPATGFTFTSWGGACSGTNVETSVLVDAARTCSAAFTASGGGGGLPTGPPYTLTITPPTGGKVLGAGLNCGAGGTACAVSMPAAMTLGIQATASSGYTFAGWSGDCSGTGASVWVDLKGARTCAANFTPVGGTTYALTIAPAPTGGTVTGNGLTCGAGGATCAVTFGSSTTATLTATPATGYTFTSWGGACSGTTSTTSVLVDAARTCSAAFTASGGGGGLPTGPPYTLTITPPTGGKVLGAGLNCGAGGTACAVTMPAAMKIGISATPSAGYTFSGWSGDCIGTATGLWVDLKGPRTCGAVFTVAANVPEPLEPINSAVIQQNRTDIGCSADPTRGSGAQIVFQWRAPSSAPSAIAGYYLIAYNEAAEYPIVDTFVSGSSYVDTSCNSFVIDQYLAGWHWQVQAVYSGGGNSAWSPLASFRFAPCRLSDGTPCYAY